MNDERGAPGQGARFPDLAGRTALVTGTSRGIGCGIAEVLAAQGMKLVLTARSAGAGQAFADLLDRGGAECLFVPADVATPEGARRVFDAAVERFARIDLLVNNAAQLRSRPFLDLDEDSYHDSFERNCRMIYGPSLLAARHMAAAGGGVIVHISSVGARRGHRDVAGYDASKGAVNALTQSMAVDLAPHHIRVNAVAPGATAFRPPVTAGPPKPRKKGRRRWHGREQYIPLNRLGTPEEIGYAVAFLASDVAGYITGQVLYVDGGLTAQLTPPGIYV
jgi:NAD(P)-dependent dehydrogenase (short-subunit alcohol dehydrogenase family)